MDLLVDDAKENVKQNEDVKQNAKEDEKQGEKRKERSVRRKLNVFKHGLIVKNILRRKIYDVYSTNVPMDIEPLAVVNQLKKHAERNVDNLKFIF